MTSDLLLLLGPIHFNLLLAQGSQLLFTRLHMCMDGFARDCQIAHKGKDSYSVDSG